MIDTVSYEQDWLRTPIDFGVLGCAWRLRGSRRGENYAGSEAVNYRKEVVCYEHSSGLTAIGNKYRLWKITFSAPKLLFERNGMLIKSQSELDEALALADQIVSSLAKPVSLERTYRRVDLVWQFAGSVTQFKQAYCCNLCPGVRSGPEVYAQSSIRWHGSEANVTAYDKGLQMGLGQEKVVRVEVQFTKARKVRNAFGSQSAIHHLDFNHCYQIYRTILCGLDPGNSVIVPSGSRRSLEARLAEVVAQAALDGHDYFPLAVEGASARTVSRFRQKVAKAKAQMIDLSFSNLLPPDGPPPPVELDLHHTVASNNYEDTDSYAPQHGDLTDYEY
jgi:hypothetical protein